MIGSKHYFTGNLLRVYILLCLIPVPAKAQLFGGMIKTSLLVPVVGVADLDCVNVTFAVAGTISGYTRPASSYFESLVTYAGTMDIPYLGGSGAAYAAGSAISSSGVTGLTATLKAGTLSYGSGYLEYTITGTPGPDTGGIGASFAINFGGISKTVNVPVISVSSLNKASNFAPTYGTEFSFYSGIITLDYTGGNGAHYPASTIVLTDGNTVTIPDGTLVKGAGQLTCNVSSNNSLGGELLPFAFKFGGATTTNSVPLCRGYVINDNVYTPNGDNVRLAQGAPYSAVDPFFTNVPGYDLCVYWQNNSSSGMYYSTAAKTCRNLDGDNIYTWRLPNIKELTVMINNSGSPIPLPNSQTSSLYHNMMQATQGHFWTTTWYDNYDPDWGEDRYLGAGVCDWNKLQRLVDDEAHWCRCVKEMKK